MAELILDPLDLESLTGTPASTWVDWVKKGTGPPGFARSFRIGRRHVWDKAAVLAWLKKQGEEASK